MELTKSFLFSLITEMKSSCFKIKRVVNFSDDHASKKVNMIVAQEIMKKLKPTH